MFFQVADISDEKLCSALVTAKIKSAEIVGLLHSAYYDRVHLPEGVTASRVTEARESVEKLLVAILAAEREINPKALETAL